MTHAMPGRPRQHELEALSRRAFEAGLPAEWVARPVGSEDYGIDYYVELFEKHQATGLLFAVQLKAVERLNAAPSVRLRWATRTYWSELGMPVLIVLWEAASAQMWWQWAHRFDPWGLAQTNKTFSIVFPVENIWNDTITPGELTQEVEAWRALDRQDFDLPLEVVLPTGASGIAGHSESALRAALRSAVNSHGDLLRLTPVSDNRVHFTVSVREIETKVWLQGAGSFTLHHEDAAAHGPDLPPKWAADIMLAISAMLIKFGLALPGARIAGVAARAASIVRHPAVAAEVMALLLDAHRTEDAIALYERLIAYAVDDPSAQVAATVALLEHGRSLEVASRQHLVAAITAWANVTPIGGPLSGAQLLYLASQLVGSDDPTQAATLLEQAAQRDAGYLERDYWHRELGGCRFLAGAFEDAAESYRRAVALGSREARPLLADALFYAGRYTEAAELFEAVAADPYTSTSEWRVKQFALAFLARQPEYRDQARQVEAAEALLAGADDDPAVLHAALKLDLLCPEALLALGRIAEDAGQSAVGWYCSAAVSALYHPVGWLASMASAQIEAPDLMEDLVACAHRFAGEQLIGLAAQADPSGHTAAELIGLFDALPGAPTEPTQIRFTTPRSAEYVAMRASEDASRDPESQYPVDAD